MNNFTIILNEQTPKVPSFNREETMDFIGKNQGMFDSFLNFAKSKNALGLAANQVGNFVQSKLHRMQTRFAAISTVDGWVLAIDPKIKEKQGKIFEATEGCLTWPDKTILAERYPKVVVNYIDRNEKEITREVYSRLESQIWQHEINHLNGVEETVVDNDFRTIRNDKPKIGRNDPCPCGSGKKFKKCCL